MNASDVKCREERQTKDGEDEQNQSFGVHGKEKLVEYGNGSDFERRPEAASTTATRAAHDGEDAAVIVVFVGGIIGVGDRARRVRRDETLSQGMLHRVKIFVRLLSRCGNKYQGMDVDGGSACCRTLT